MSRTWLPRPPGRYYPRPLWRRIIDYGLTIVLLGLLILLAARLDRVETRTDRGRAVINDGDTLTIGAERIRLRGIDAPEYRQTCRRDSAEYACGQLARQALVKLIADRPVSCSGWQRDRYGRFLGTCKAGEVDLNRSLVEAGWAVAYGGYEAEQRTARAGKLGIWAGSFEQPQDWRRAHDQPAERRHDVLGSVGDGLRELFRF